MLAFFFSLPRSRASGSLAGPGRDPGDNLMLLPVERDFVLARFSLVADSFVFPREMKRTFIVATAAIGALLAADSSQA